MTLMYSFEKEYNKWDTEPDVFEDLFEDESENAKVADELSLEEISEDEIEMSESEFDL